MFYKERIKIARELHNWSRSDLGKAIGKSYDQVRMWEKGIRKPKYENVVLIAKATDVKIEFFYGDMLVCDLPWENEDYKPVINYEMGL